MLCRWLMLPCYGEVASYRRHSVGSNSTLPSGHQQWSCTVYGNSMWADCSEHPSRQDLALAWVADWGLNPCPSPCGVPVTGSPGNSLKYYFKTRGQRYGVYVLKKSGAADSRGTWGWNNHGPQTLKTRPQQSSHRVRHWASLWTLIFGQTDIWMDKGALWRRNKIA